ncbi:MAG: D-alanyl-D-alanine carboxypeptidase [Lachnospiraceae bacterium]|nr:D-alanyl-D-alanine carboxypeptidase [Lachnospiraceae bacterium]
MFKIKTLMTKIITGVTAVSLVLGNAVVSTWAAVDNNRVCTIDSNARSGWPQAADFQSGTACVMEASTGTVLLDKGMNDVRYPASITKVMTALIALENSSLDTQVTFTGTGMADAYAGSSNINPQLGETFTMEQCLYMILIKSANDVSTQVAEVVGGSVQNFVDMMNQKAAALGCTNTHFMNASGLENDDHYTTAHDMALIGQEAWKNEMFRTILSTPSYVVGPTNMTAGSRVYDTHVEMLPGGVHFYDGCLGGKTGYTDVSQSTLITFDRRNDMDLISVVMYAPGSDVAATDSMQILDYAYNNFKLQDGKIVTTQGYPVENDIVITPEPTRNVSKTNNSKNSVTTNTPAADENISDKAADNTDKDQSFASKAVGIGVYIAIGVLGAMVGIGLFMIIISAVIKAKKKKRRRQRREQQRQQDSQNRRRR